MAKYHINYRGESGVCQALSTCPFGGPEDHFSSPEEARLAYESHASQKFGLEGIRKSQSGIPAAERQENGKLVETLDIIANSGVDAATARTLAQSALSEIPQGQKTAGELGHQSAMASPMETEALGDAVEEDYAALLARGDRAGLEEFGRRLYVEFDRQKLGDYESNNPIPTPSDFDPSGNYTRDYQEAVNNWIDQAQANLLVRSGSVLLFLDEVGKA